MTDVCARTGPLPWLWGSTHWSAGGHDGVAWHKSHCHDFGVDHSLENLRGQACPVKIEIPVFSYFGPAHGVDTGLHTRFCGPERFADAAHLLGLFSSSRAGQKGSGLTRTLKSLDRSSSPRPSGKVEGTSTALISESEIPPPAPEATRGKRFSMFFEVFDKIGIREHRVHACLVFGAVDFEIVHDQVTLLPVSL